MKQEYSSKVRDYVFPKNRSEFVYVRVGREDGLPLWSSGSPPRTREFP